MGNAPHTSNVRIPSYRLHKASGQAVVTLNSKDIYLGTYNSNSSRDMYDRVIAEWLASGRTSKRADHGEITVDELVVLYWEHSEVYYEQQSLYSLIQALRGFRRLYGDTDACEIGPLALKAFRQVEIDRGLSRSTINKYVGWIKSMIRWAVEEELLPPDRLQAASAVRGLRAGRSNARETPAVSPVHRDIIDRTLSKLSSTVADMVRVQLLTGMRPGELCGMTPRELNMSREPWIFTPRHHKNQHHGKAREIAIGPRAIAILQRHLLRSLDDAVFRPEIRSGCTSENASQARPAPLGYTTAAYRRAIRRACDAADVVRWSPNQLRHTCATAIREQYGIDAVSAVLGHSKVETSQIYAERARGVAENIALRSG